jgi:hypothetical protein
MFATLRRITSLAIIFLFLLGAVTLPAVAQQTSSQLVPSTRLKPLSLPHLYWHFLIHQSVLDARAKELNAEGKNGTPLRNYLQTRLGFSDADYAPIRESSQRLASELNALNQQAKSLRLSGSDSGQLELLLDDRETYIDNEVYALSNELSPQKKVTLEKFMAQFFAPKEVSIQIPQSSSATTGKAASK